MQPVTIEALRSVHALSELPDDHLQWILDRSEYHEYPDGTQLRKTGDDADVMFIIIEGGISFYMDVHGRLVFYHHFANDEATGGVSGLLPHSRMKTYPGCSFATGKLRMVQLPKKFFPELEQLNPDLIQRLIGYMTERAKAFATLQTQREKVNALGQLSAGIAHELNNPASAINRISAELIKKLKLNFDLTENLLRHDITSEHIQSLRLTVETMLQLPAPRLTALQRMEREDEIIAWLDKAGVKDSSQLSETFVEAGFSGKEFESIRNEVSPEAFSYAVYWLENLLSSHRILKDMEEASSRISFLVSAIKSHVHMDRTNELQSTNIHQDIENTLTLLGYKIREKNINVQRHFAGQLPDVPAYVGELNQVWTNLIDNAVYALPKGGELTVETSFDDKHVIVKIMDNGSGIPAEIQSRIFDPFFTTKKVGDGTGIGLDLVSRIVKRHNGTIEVNSVPGKTVFTISLPLVQVN